MKCGVEKGEGRAGRGACVLFTKNALLARSRRCLPTHLPARQPFPTLPAAEVVFNARGDREAALSAAAREMLGAFEALLTRLVEERSREHSAQGMQGAGALGSGESEGSDTPGPLDLVLRCDSSSDLVMSDTPRASPGSRRGSSGGDSSPGAGQGTAGPSVGLLQRFDEAWVAYLEQFAAWKLADAGGHVACALRCCCHTLQSTSCPWDPARNIVRSGVLSGHQTQLCLAPSPITWHTHA